NKRVVLSKNSPLNMIRLDSSRVFLQTRLFDKGYADAAVDTAIVLDSAARTAAVTFTLNPKYKTTVEDIVVNGNDDVSTRTILKSLTFHIGDIFKRSEMLRSQRALYESNLFRRAAIEPRPPIDIATPDSAKVVVVTVQESPSREARVSAGFNTIDFGQFESRFTDYNFFGSARRLDVQGVVGNLFAKSSSGRGIFQNATLAQTSSLARYFVPTYNAGIDRTNDPFSPNTGYRANASVEHASTFTVSDFRYNRATTDGAAFYQVRKRGAIGAHARVGWVRSLGSTAQAVGISASLGDGVLHPRKRFYAGGSHSVRGFGENQLGPRVLTVPISVLQTHDSTNAACLTGTDVTTC